ncbi:glycoside hydrolase family 3 protein [Ruminiclostridium cellobioparum]|uniref:beta-glucosidase n=1 Tax=Ruminiclostridium cellobioparum subsp. termitidis CT1112 TaxID=1195236 RepID=S0FQH7_RUMCE|nr:glycoside hydrolase family 3 protein [Ruminiclostridium cellobioparum]EMS71414.1 glycoside hydrolase family 3 domain protein [Ruminiclostridium cellobioparum subsp. termitidis CT1112]
MGNKKAVVLVMLLLISIFTGSCSDSGERASVVPGVNVSVPDNGYNELESLYDEKKSVDENISAFLNEMTLEEKVGQMLQVERRSISSKDIQKFFIGSVLAAGGSVPEKNTMVEWRKLTDEYKSAAVHTRLGIPLLFAIDAVHGNNNLENTVIYPHNIGLGAGGDSELAGKIAGATALELNAAGIDWNFSPCVAVSNDIRWGRSYESFSENPDLVSIMSIPYITNMQKNGVVACAKHYVADGAVSYGTGDSGYLMDQGNVNINQKDLNDTCLSVYQEAINAGVKSIMVSYSSINNEKNHGNKYLLQDRLKDDMGFNGIVISDFEGIHQLKGGSLYDKVVLAVDAGIDVLMEASQWRECYEALIEAVGNGDIRTERINDAVTRVLRVKMEMGKFENVSSIPANEYSLRNIIHKQIAEEAVLKSLVLLKNKDNIIPFGNNQNIAVIGPAADNIGIQCGGWTKTWQGGMDNEDGRWMSGTTILDGFKELAGKKGHKIITDIAKLEEADIIVAVLGEYPYAEGKGDDDSMDLVNGTALADNEKTLKAAYAAKKPIVVILVSGRPRLITDEIDRWDGLVQAWLPGTEGGVIARAFYGDAEFTARLPVTWPRNLEQLPITLYKQSDGYNALFPYGYGLNVKN